jgi:hypothetical protein
VSRKALWQPRRKVREELQSELRKRTTVDSGGANEVHVAFKSVPSSKLSRTVRTEQTSSLHSACSLETEVRKAL